MLSLVRVGRVVAWRTFLFAMRKVRTPQSTMLGNTQARRLDGKCNRKQVAAA